MTVKGWLVLGWVSGLTAGQSQSQNLTTTETTTTTATLVQDRGMLAANGGTCAFPAMFDGSRSVTSTPAGAVITGSCDGSPNSVCAATCRPGERLDFGELPELTSAGRCNGGQGRFQLVFRQTFDADGEADDANVGLGWTSWTSRNPSDPAAAQFSVLDTLEDYRMTDGSFELKLVWPDPEDQDRSRRETAAAGAGAGAGAEKDRGRRVVQEYPASATICATEHGTCVCAGRVWYGFRRSTRSRWTSREWDGGQSVGCNNRVFGDPWVGQVKECRCEATPLEPLPALNFNHWKQTSNPVATSAFEAVAGGGGVVGYADVVIYHRANGWGGLERSSTPASFLDGAVGSDRRYYAVGAATAFNGGLPGFSAAPVPVTELYACRENPAVETVATYTCDGDGPAYAASSAAAACIPNTCDPMELPRGTVTGSCSGAAGGTCTYGACEEGFELSSYGNSTRTCTGGDYDGQPKECVPVRCTPVRLGNGQVDGDCEGEVGDTCSYAGCNPGYILSDTGSPSRTCVVEDGLGRYTGAPKTCVVDFWQQAARCRSTGDPHFTSLDGRNFDFQQLGLHTLFGSPNVQVQVRHTRWGRSRAAVNTWAAVSGPGMNGDLLQWFAAPQGDVVIMNGRVVPANLRDGDFVRTFTHPDTQQQASYTMTTGGGGGRVSGLILTLSDGVEIRIGSANGRYMNLYLLVPGTYRRSQIFNGTHGLCGNFDLDPQDDPDPDTEIDPCESLFADRIPDCNVTRPPTPSPTTGSPTVAPTSSAPTPPGGATIRPPADDLGCVPLWGQCGGRGHVGGTQCDAESVCVGDDWYRQCVVRDDITNMWDDCATSEGCDGMMTCRFSNGATTGTCTPSGRCLAVSTVATTVATTTEDPNKSPEPSTEEPSTEASTAATTTEDPNKSPEPSTEEPSTEASTATTTGGGGGGGIIIGTIGGDPGVTGSTVATTTTGGGGIVIGTIGGDPGVTGSTVATTTPAPTVATTEAPNKSPEPSTEEPSTEASTATTGDGGGGGIIIGTIGGDPGVTGSTIATTTGGSGGGGIIIGTIGGDPGVTGSTMATTTPAPTRSPATSAPTVAPTDSTIIIIPPGGDDTGFNGWLDEADSVIDFTVFGFDDDTVAADKNEIVPITEFDEADCDHDVLDRARELCGSLENFGEPYTDCLADVCETVTVSDTDGSNNGNDTDVVAMLEVVFAASEQAAVVEAEVQAQVTDINTVKCPRLALLHGTTSGSCDGSFGSVCSFDSCDVGFQLSVTGNATRECRKLPGATPPPTVPGGSAPFLGAYSGASKQCIKAPVLTVGMEHGRSHPTTGWLAIPDETVTLDLKVFAARGSHPTTLSVALPAWAAAVSAEVVAFGAHVIEPAIVGQSRNNISQSFNLDFGALENTGEEDPDRAPPLVTEADMILVRIVAQVSATAVDNNDTPHNLGAMLQVLGTATFSNEWGVSVSLPAVAVTHHGNTTPVVGGSSVTLSTQMVVSGTSAARSLAGMCQIAGVQLTTVATSMGTAATCSSSSQECDGRFAVGDSVPVGTVVDMVWQGVVLPGPEAGSTLALSCTTTWGAVPGASHATDFEAGSSAVLAIAPVAVVFAPQADEPAGSAAVALPSGEELTVFARASVPQGTKVSAMELAVHMSGAGFAVANATLAAHGAAITLNEDVVTQQAFSPNTGGDRRRAVAAAAGIRFCLGDVVAASGVEADNVVTIGDENVTVAPGELIFELRVVASEPAADVVEAPVQSAALLSTVSSSSGVSSSFSSAFTIDSPAITTASTTIPATATTETTEGVLGAGAADAASADEAGAGAGAVAAIAVVVVLVALAVMAVGVQQQRQRRAADKNRNADSDMELNPSHTLDLNSGDKADPIYELSSSNSGSPHKLINSNSPEFQLDNENKSFRLKSVARNNPAFDSEGRSDSYNEVLESVIHEGEGEPTYQLAANASRAPAELDYALASGAPAVDYSVAAFGKNSAEYAESSGADATYDTATAVGVRDGPANTDGAIYSMATAVPLENSQFVPSEGSISRKPTLKLEPTYQLASGTLGRNDPGDEEEA